MGFVGTLLGRKRKLVRIHHPLLQYHVLLSSSTAINQKKLVTLPLLSLPIVFLTGRFMVLKVVIVKKMIWKALIMNLIVKEKARLVMLILLVSD